MSSLFNLTGKTALISASTLGIGLASAIALAQQGARVIVNGRTQERVDKAVAQIRKDAPKADVAGFVADLTTAAGANAIHSAHPAVDILVNNLGFAPVTAFETTSDEEWAKLYNDNVISGVRLTRLYLPHLRAQNWGRVIYISASAAEAPVGIAINFSASKSAQIAAARGLAEALAGTNITVNSIVVGITDTAALDRFLTNSTVPLGASKEVVSQAFVAGTLIKRALRAEEIAAAVVYLSSPAASGTTGSALRVEGGAVHHI